MASGVTEAASELLGVLAGARALIAQRDQDGQLPSRSVPDSVPPWNAAAANAIYAVHAEVRQLEAGIRTQVSRGTSTRRRGGSDANTDAAIKALVDMSPSVPDGDAQEIARQFTRWARPLQRLPGIDEATVWRPIRMRPGDPQPPCCPYCETKNLRLADRSYVVMCFYRDCPGDTDGNRPPFARIDVNRLTGDAILAWSDGLVQGG